MTRVNKLSNQDLKTRFIVLNMAIEYIDPYKYIEENPQLVREIMESTTDTITLGKYVINCLESLLKQAKAKNSGSDKSKSS